MRPTPLRAVTSTSDRRQAEALRATFAQRLWQAVDLPRWRGSLAVVGDSPFARTGGFGLALGGILAFSFLWVWHLGHRGVFTHDPSIVFDGARRIVQGQVPYRDFVMSFGPVTFALGALAFWAMGVDFSGLVLTAALISSVACAVTIRIGWLLTGRWAPLALLAGFMSAVWFQAPSATPWMDQTAFFFDLLALWAIIEARVGHGARGPVLLAGVASAAAVLSAQMAGTAFVIVCVGALCAPGNERQREVLLGLGWYVAGIALAAAAFGGWLFAVSAGSAFERCWLGASAEITLTHVAYRKILGALVFQPLIPSSIPLFLLASLVGALEVSRLIVAPARARLDVRPALCAWLCIALPQFQGVFQLTTEHDARNDNAFVGLCVVSLAALLSRWKRAAPRLSWQEGVDGVRVHLGGAGAIKATAAVVGVLSLCSLGEGLTVGARRFDEGVERSGTDPTPQAAPMERCGSASRPECRCLAGQPGQ
jgi:hypothetical protein